MTTRLSLLSLHVQRTLCNFFHKWSSRKNHYKNISTHRLLLFTHVLNSLLLSQTLSPSLLPSSGWIFMLEMISRRYPCCCIMMQMKISVDFIGNTQHQWQHYHNFSHHPHLAKRYMVPPLVNIFSPLDFGFDSIIIWWLLIRFSCFLKFNFGFLFYNKNYRAKIPTNFFFLLLNRTLDKIAWLWQCQLIVINAPHWKKSGKTHHFNQFQL